MPNHVEHDLTLEYEGVDYEVQFQKFHDFWIAHLENLSETLIPYPPEREIINAPLNEWEKNNPDKPVWSFHQDGFRDWYNSGGYEWCREKWGSKWGMYDLDIDDQYDNSGYYTFKTAWSPSLPLYLALSLRFPEIYIRITYFECGAQFHGYYLLKNGNVDGHEEVKYFGRRGG